MSDPGAEERDLRRILWEADGEFDAKKRIAQRFAPSLIQNMVVWFNRLGSRQCVIELEDGQDIRANIVRCDEAEAVGKILQEASRKWREREMTKASAIKWAKAEIRIVLGDELVEELYVHIRKVGYSICRTRTKTHRPFVVDYWPGKYAPQFAGQEDLP